MTLEDAVTADLKRWGDAVAATSMAASALDLARRLDVPGVRPAAASMLHTQLRATLIELEKLAPVAVPNDEIAAAKKKRDERLGA